MTRQARRSMILRAAEKLFLSGGFDQVTLDEVSRKAAVGKGTIYRYFEDKEDLYSQVIIVGLDRFHDRLRKKVVGPGSPEQKLIATGEALGVFYRRHHNLFRSLHAARMRRMARRGGLMREIRSRRRGIVQTVGSVVREASTEGTYRSDIPPDAAARLFLALAHAALWSRDDGGRGPVAIKHVVSLFVDGMRRR